MNEFGYTHKYTHKIHVTTVILQKIRKKNLISKRLNIFQTVWGF